jgi:hypothetical protein
MPEKVRKNLLGRTVIKTKSDDGSVNRTVYGRDRQLLKSSTKTSFGKGKTKYKGDTMNIKTTGKHLGEGVTKKKMKIMTDPATKSTVTKKTVSGPGMKKERSVVTKKPGEKFSYTNLGPVSQARAFNYQKKKLKK